jgi:hypothetical protein
MTCEHTRLKKNYPFGRNSKPQFYCKDCGIVIKPKDLEQRKNTKKIQRRKFR